MPAPNTSLTTRETVKAYLNLSDATWDTVIDGEIDAVSQAIENYCNRTFGLAALIAEKIDGDGTVDLQLRFPIVSVTSISNDGAVVVETTNYEKYNDRGVLVLTDGTVWTNGRKKITATYNYGYSQDDLPRPIVSAATQWVCKKFDDITQKRIGVSSVTRGDESVSYEKEMPKEVQALISPYVIPIGGWA